MGVMLRAATPNFVVDVYLRGLKRRVCWELPFNEFSSNFAEN